MSDDLVAFLRASVFFSVSVFAMCADNWWAHGQAAVSLGALIFIPLAVSFLWWLLTAASLVVCCIEAARTRKPAADHQRIAELEAEIWL